MCFYSESASAEALLYILNPGSPGSPGSAGSSSETLRSVLKTLRSVLATLRRQAGLAANNINYIAI